MRGLRFFIVVQSVDIGNISYPIFIGKYFFFTGVVNQYIFLFLVLYRFREDN